MFLMKKYGNNKPEIFVIKIMVNTQVKQITHCLQDNKPFRRPKRAYLSGVLYLGHCYYLAMT